MGTPLQTTWNFLMTELSNMITWLSTVTLYNVPLIGYFIGLLVLGILLDYIF